MAKGWYWRGNVAHYDFEVNGARYRGSLGIKKNSGVIDGKSPEDRASAEVRALIVQYEQNLSITQIWEQTQKRLNGNKTTKACFGDVWGEFSKKGLSNAGKDRSDIYASHIRSFFTWLNNEHREISYVSQITNAIAKEYITYLRNIDGAPATKNDKLATLKMVFGSIDFSINPFENIKPMPLKSIPREIFTPEQVHILFHESSGWYRRLFITALSTFQREEDCCLIKKSYIHLDINRIKFPFTYKTGQEIDLPMLPKFREIVEEALADTNNKTEYLFPDLANLYMKSSSTIGTKVKKFLAEKGICNTIIEVDGYSRRVSTLDVHSIRHTAAVLAVLAGWPLPMVMKATGHRSLKTLMRYINHISEEQKENYFFQFGKTLPGLSGGVEQSGTDVRKRLSDLAYSLPLEEVERLLSMVKRPQAITLDLPKSL